MSCVATDRCYCNLLNHLGRRTTHALSSWDLLQHPARDGLISLTPSGEFKSFEEVNA